MNFSFKKTLRAAAAGATIALAAPVLFAPMSVSAYAQTQDVMLENITSGPVTIAKIEIKGTNATQEQVQQLLAGTMPPADMQTFLKGLSAASISIPSIEVKPPEGGSLSISGFAVENLAAAEGKLGSVAIDNIAVDGPANSPFKGKFTAMSLKGVDAADFIAAVESGGIESIASDPSKIPRFELLTMGASEMSGPIDGSDKPMDVKIGGVNLIQGDFVGKIPTRTEFAMNNIVFKFPEGSEQATQMKALGYDEMDLSMAGKGAWNKDAKTYALQDMTITMANGAKLTINANLGNIDETFFLGDPQTAMMAMLTAGVSDLSVSFANEGLVEKGLALAGQTQGKSAEQMQQEAQAMASAMLPTLLGTDPGAQTLVKAITDFVASPKNISVSAKAKSGMLTAQDFAAVATPADIFGKIDVTATANQ
jgi:hypothetical protein